MLGGLSKECPVFFIVAFLSQLQVLLASQVSLNQIRQTHDQLSKYATKNFQIPPLEDSNTQNSPPDHDEKINFEVREPKNEHRSEDSDIKHDFIGPVDGQIRKKRTTSGCPDPTRDTLHSILGQSFNPSIMVDRRSDLPTGTLPPTEYRPYSNNPKRSSRKNLLLDLAHNLGRSKRSRRGQTDPFSAALPLPWECESLEVWRDLGTDYYPRYIREYECMSNQNCWYGHYKCKPKYYKAKVLRRNTERCAPDMSLPAEIRNNWLLRDIGIAIYCECGR
ncbi:unnamed protein product [Owenia fusiformis]|uniref:Uncharacterized protein n=1 Tax=Owenia fusiformis TaxID=6347 RepID=A0A8J1TW28_OWEFU|nr:unnamed protein product [Owenia fusiformis]